MLLVTGGSGFLGSHILLTLLQNDVKVRAICRSDSSPEITRFIFTAYSNDPEALLKRIEWVDADILDPWSMKEAMQGVSRVIHAAGLVSWSHHDKKKLYDTNILGTANVVNSALVCGVEKLVYIGSIAAFGGKGGPGIMNEETAWNDLKPNYEYGKSKLGGEREVWRGMAEGLKVVVLNPSIIMGLHHPNQGTAQLFSTIWQGLHYFPSGTNAFVCARDVARAAMLLSQANVEGERFILSEGNYTYQRIFEMIATSLDKPKPTKKAGSFLMEMAWRYDYMNKLLTGKKTRLQRDNARISAREYYYNGEKIMGLEGFSYTPMVVCIEELSKKLMPWLK